MHFEIPALFVQSEQATWVQECGVGSTAPILEQEIFPLLTVTATLTIVHFEWFRDFGIPEEISFLNINLKYFKTLKTHCINCYSLETIFLMTGNYFRLENGHPENILGKNELTFN